MVAIGEEIVRKKKDKMLFYKMKKNTPSPYHMQDKNRVIRVIFKCSLIYARSGNLSTVGRAL